MLKIVLVRSSSEREKRLTGRLIASSPRTQGSNKMDGFFKIYIVSVAFNRIRGIIMGGIVGHTSVVLGFDSSSVASIGSAQRLAKAILRCTPSSMLR